MNIKSGAKGRASAIINGVAVALIAFVFLSSFRYLPLPIVAAILVFVAARMVEAEHFIHLYKSDKRSFWMSMVVAAITIVEDPIVGIAVGASVSLLFFVNELSKSRSEITLNRDKQLVAQFSGSNDTDMREFGGDTLVYRFAGEMTYINAQAHIETLSNLHDSVKTVVLHFRNLFYIDIDGLDAIGDIIESFESKGITVYISTVNEYSMGQFRQAAWFRRAESEERVFAHTRNVLEHLGFPLSTEDSPSAATASTA
ncbi:MAG: STAS domain-containing protein [Candidatus Poribacteria bacterium]|nr:STAS domain-containing protein [Candidatus Poribacteria bacterium]